MKSSLYTLDIGNTNPHMGLFIHDKLESVSPLTPQTFLDESCPLIIAQVGNFNTSFIPTKNILRVKELRIDNFLFDMPINYSETLGDDRLALAYYAFKDYGQTTQKNSLVIDSGSFTTIDLVSAEGFMGGFILPGKKAYAQSFNQGHLLKDVDISTSHNSLCLIENHLPQDTNSALREGWPALLFSMIKELSERFKIERIYVTGGDSSSLLFLKTALPNCHFFFGPHLIHYALFKLYQSFQENK